MTLQTLIGNAGNALIAQSGGPTAVINASLVGAIRRARENKDIIRNMFGSYNACEGMLKPDNSGLTDLFSLSEDELKRLEYTPGSALGSSRKKAAEIGDEKGKIIPVRLILDAIKRLGVRYFFYIGGNDSAKNCWQISRAAKDEGYALLPFHIPKTIDDDLLENNHTPGYGSAARFIANAFIGDDLDNRSLLGIKINVTMGRHAGFLVGAAALAKLRKGAREDDGPHLIYFPERIFDMNSFLEDIREVHSKYGRALIAVSEGIEDKDGKPIGTNGEYDGQGNPELDGMLVAQRLAEEIKKSGISKRVRADCFGYIQRSFPLAISENDRREATMVGRHAVSAAVSGLYDSGSIALRRDKEHGTYTEVVSLSAVAEVEGERKNTRRMPDNFINERGNYVTQEFIDYALPLIGELAETGSIRRIPVKAD